MTIHRTIGSVAATCAVIVLALAAGSPGAANSRIPELGNTDPPAKKVPPAKARRASFVLLPAGSGPCVTETYVIELNGRRLATAC